MGPKGREAMAKRFGEPAAFKASLKSRFSLLAAGPNTPLITLQLKLVIERFLARLFRAPRLLKRGFSVAGAAATACKWAAATHAG